jgi:hypothetical protein
VCQLRSTKADAKVLGNESFADSVFSIGKEGIWIFVGCGPEFCALEAEALATANLLQGQQAARQRRIITEQQQQQQRKTAIEKTS